MGMLERLSDARGTLEGKIVAVILAILLVLPVATVTAFANSDAEEKAKEETKTEEVVEKKDAGAESVVKEELQETKVDAPALVNEVEPQLYEVAVTLAPGTRINPDGIGLTEASCVLPAWNTQDFKFEAFTFPDYGPCKVTYNKKDLKPVSGFSYVIPQADLTNKGTLVIEKVTTPDPDEGKDPGEGEEGNPGTTTPTEPTQEARLTIRFNDVPDPNDKGFYGMPVEYTGSELVCDIPERYRANNAESLMRKSGWHFLGWTNEKKDAENAEFRESTLRIPANYKGDGNDHAFELYPVYIKKQFKVEVDPYEAKYDGKEHGVTVKVETPNDEPYTVEYSKDGISWQPEPFKCANVADSTDVYVRVKYADQEKVEKSYVRINKAPLTITTDSATAGYTGNALTAPGKTEGFENGEDQKAQFTVTGSQTKVGESKNTYEIVWNTVDKENYEITEKLGTLTVTKGAFKATATSYEGIYDARSHGITVSVEGLQEGASPTYHYTYLDPESNQWSEETAEAPVWTDVTKQPVKVSCRIECDGYEDVKLEGFITIKPVLLTVGINAVDTVYNGTDVQASDLGAQVGLYIGELSEKQIAEKYSDQTKSGSTFTLIKRDDGTYESAEVYATGSGKDAGVYYMDYNVEYADDTNEANYKVDWKHIGRLVIAQKPLNVTTESAEKVYDGSPLEGTGSVTGFVDGEGASITFKSNQEDVGKTLNDSYDIAYNEGTNSDNYYIAEKEIGTLEVTPRPVLITANSYQKAYLEPDPKLEVTFSGIKKDDGTYEEKSGLVDGKGSVSYTSLQREAGENVGNYAIAVSGEKNQGNYEVTFIPGNLRIVASNANTVNAEPAEKTFDGESISIEQPTAGVEGSTIEYSTDGVEWSETNPSFTNAGVYTVWVRAKADNYETTNSVETTVTIRRKAVTISVNDAGKVVGTGDPAFTGSVDGLVEGYPLEDVEYYRNGDEELVGFYGGALIARYKENSNYEVLVNPGDFTIDAAPVAPVTPPTPGPLDALVTTVTDFLATPIIGPGAMAAEGIADGETPLAQIDDEGNPLSAFDHPVCWVHYYILLGIIITAIYGGGVIARRLGYNHTIKKYEDDVTGESRNSEPLKKPVAKEGTQPTI